MHYYIKAIIFREGGNERGRGRGGGREGGGGRKGKREGGESKRERLGRRLYLFSNVSILIVVFFSLAFGCSICYLRFPIDSSHP